mgnify:CR=1 FL=1|jgi:hypothetical protein
MEFEWIPIKSENQLNKLGGDHELRVCVRGDGDQSGMIYRDVGVGYDGVYDMINKRNGKWYHRFTQRQVENLLRYTHYNIVK